MDYEQENVNFGELETTDESLADVVKTTREYIKRRQQNLQINSNFADTEQADVDEIKANIRDWMKRTNKAING